jgi:hypothetical protein
VCAENKFLFKPKFRKSELGETVQNAEDQGAAGDLNRSIV